MDKSKYYTIKIALPTVELTQDEWDNICELLKSEYGYTTRAECRKHFQDDVRVYAEYLGDKWSMHKEDYGCL
jgi:hypothetical protein